MKKKLEADLISIAHRILKLKNRAELDQLQQETLKLYEKISVLRFVEDHFSGAEPTIGRASAVFELEGIYDIEHVDAVKGNEQEAIEDEAHAKKAEEKKAEKEQDKENDGGKDIDTDGSNEAPVSAEEESEVAAEAEPDEEEDTKETAAAETKEEPKEDTENGEEEVSEEEKELTEESDEEVSAEDDKPEPESENEPAGKEGEVKEEPEQEETAKEEIPVAPEGETEEPAAEEPKAEEPVVKVEVTKPAETIEAEEQSAVAVFEKEHDSTVEEVAAAADAEIKTIDPDNNAAVEAPAQGFEFAYERVPAPEEPAKQKEITFEDYADYKEPEFIKKDALATDISTPVPPEVKEEILEENDWRNWEPKKIEGDEKPKPAFDWDATIQPKKEEEPVADDWQNWEPASTPGPAQPASSFSWNEPKPEPVQEEPKPAAPKVEGYGKTISLALNDRIAFEKHLFAGSGDDLNRVISQLNTLNSYREAQNFIEDLVKPDYNNWNGKDEYAERFMALVEKRFS